MTRDLRGLDPREADPAIVRIKIHRTKIKQVLAAVIAACLPLFFALPASAAMKDGDWQIWNTYDIQTKISKDVDLQIEQEFRYGNDVSRLYYYHTEGGFEYNIVSWLSAGAAYRQVTDKVQNKWKEEYRPMINATLKSCLYGFKLSDRNRLEFRIRRYENGQIRYRNKATLVFPWKVTPINIQPYTADEIFIDSNVCRINENRFYAGLKMEFLKNLKGDLYYLLKSNGNKGKWTNYNVIGIKIITAF